MAPQATITSREKSRKRSFYDTSNQFLASPRAKFQEFFPLSPVGNFRQERRQVGGDENVSLPPGVLVQRSPVSLTLSLITLIQPNKRPLTPVVPHRVSPVPPPSLGQQGIPAPAEVSQQLLLPLGLVETQWLTGCLCLHWVLINIDSSLLMAAHADNPVIATNGLWL